MPIGVLTNCASVLAGGAIGSALGHILPASLKEHLPTMFGLCSIAIGINSIIKASAIDAGGAGAARRLHHRSSAGS